MVLGDDAGGGPGPGDDVDGKITRPIELMLFRTITSLSLLFRLIGG
jgi:hypothetical protein